LPSTKKHVISLLYSLKRENGTGTIKQTCQTNTKSRAVIVGVLGVDTSSHQEKDFLYLLKDNNGDFTWRYGNIPHSPERFLPDYKLLNTNSKMGPHDTRSFLEKTNDDQSGVHIKDAVGVMNYRDMWEMVRRTNHKRYVCWFGSHKSKEDNDDQNTLNFY